MVQCEDCDYRMPAKTETFADTLIDRHERLSLIVEESEGT